MSSALMVELRENLKALNLAATARGLETSIRQAKESGPGYDEFLLDLTTTELEAKAEHRLTRTEHSNVMFLGRSGTGKTHLATALGIEACRNNYRTRFVSCYGLVNELIEARQERELRRLIGRHARYDLLILDELGYIPFSKEGGELLFQVLAERQEKGSVIITTNLGFADWTQVFGDPVMTAALLDRLTHRAHIITCQWDSFRLKQSLRGRPSKTEK
jgi:DNA replication protein DnaC